MMRWHGFGNLTLYTCTRNLQIWRIFGRANVHNQPKPPRTRYEVYTTLSLLLLHYISTVQKKLKRQTILRCENFKRCPRGFRPIGSYISQFVMPWRSSLILFLGKIGESGNYNPWGRRFPLTRPFLINSIWWFHMAVITDGNRKLTLAHTAKTYACNVGWTKSCDLPFKWNLWHCTIYF